jgi:hypothetical protein
MMEVPDVRPRSRGPVSARWRAVAFGAVVLAGALSAVLLPRGGAADNRCVASPVFDLPAALSTSEGLRAYEGAHLIGRWPVEEGALEVWLIVTDGKVSEAFLTLSRRQLKRTTGALPQDVANCIKVMAALDPAGQYADVSSWLVRPALAAVADGSYRIIRSCAVPKSKTSPSMCHYALERREQNVWKSLAVFMANVSRG